VKPESRHFSRIRKRASGAGKFDWSAECDNTSNFDSSLEDLEFDPHVERESQGNGELGSDNSLVKLVAGRDGTIEWSAYIGRNDQCCCYIRCQQTTAGAKTLALAETYTLRIWTIKERTQSSSSFCIGSERITLEWQDRPPAD
jgi:hypothetical protein